MPAMQVHHHSLSLHTMKQFIERRAAPAVPEPSTGRGWLMSGSQVDARHVEASQAGPRIIGSITLTFAQRTLCELQAQDDAGHAVALALPHGTVLRAGDLIVTASGEALQVKAATETVLEVRSDDSLLLARIAYHLGSRHAALQLGDSEGINWLRLLPDPALEAVIERLGGRIETISNAFDPEAPIQSPSAPACEHDHVHGPDCGHDHAHGHHHDHDHHEGHVHGPHCQHGHSHEPVAVAVPLPKRHVHGPGCQHDHEHHHGHDHGHHHDKPGGH